MKMIIDRKKMGKMGKNLNFYLQIFMIIVFMGLFVFNRFESKRPEKEIRDNIPAITLYKEDGLLGDKLFFSYRNSNLYILTMGSKAYASEEEIVEYYKECFIKHGWKYDGCRDNIDYSNHSKIENVYLFNKGIYELTLNFHQSDLLDEQVIRQKKPLKYYITVHPKHSY